MKKRLITIVLGVLILTTSYAQNNNDAGLWCTFNVEKKLNKKFSVSLTEEMRIRENYSRLNLFYTEVGLIYSPAKFMKIELAYRPIQKYLETDLFSMRHRLLLDITVKKKVQDFTLSYRHRLQREVRNIYSSEDGTVPEWYSRNKVEVKYELNKKFSPYASCELRYQLDDPRNMESNHTWHRGRYVAGVDYSINKKNTFGLYYLIQNEWNVSSSENLFVLGLEYSLTL